MPEAQKLQSEEGFVSISRAALLLGTSERSVRRAASLLPDTDRQKRQGSPAQIRLSSLAVQMGRADLPDNAGQMPDTPDNKKAALPDSTEEDTRQKAADAGHAGQGKSDGSALVEQLRSEVDYLRSALVASQQIASQAQQLQLIAERKVAELEGKALPAREQIEASGLTGGDSGASEVSGGGIVPPGATEEPRRGFWSFLRRWW